jgi:formylglycine-generating enzyme required for sulfatase activity
MPPAFSPTKECTDCPEMIVVPAGDFVMGSPETEKDRSHDESPQHMVTIGKPFAAARFELTFDEWDACAVHGDCDPRLSASGWGRGRQPVINVSWDDAQQHVAWLSRMTGQPYRLLTEAEWEYAARAGFPTAYYWGDEIGKGNANCSGCGSQWDQQQTAPVGSFAPMRSASSTWPATCGNGCRIAIILTITGRPATARRGPAEIAIMAVSFAAVPGTTFRGTWSKP